MTNTDMRIPWRNVAIGSMLLNLGAIGTIATVATIRGSDALATVALALAIVAFICQLIVFSVQTWQSGEQLKQAENLNSETRGLVAELRTRVESTYEMVASQYRELLHLTVLKSEAQISKIVEPEARPRGDTAVNTLAAIDDIPVVASTTPLDQRPLDTALEWPTRGDARRSIEALKSIGRESLNSLVMDAAIDTVAQVTHSDPTAAFALSDQPLLDAGLVVKAPGRPSNFDVQVTEKGRIAARLLSAKWPPPPELEGIADEIWALREQLDSEKIGVIEAIRRYRDFRVNRNPMDGSSS